LACVLFALPAWPGGSAADEPTPQLKTRNVMLVLVDGLRWQEVFGGADAKLMNTAFGGIKDLDAVKREFWRESAEERRAILMPFTWTVLAKQGQLIGNQWKGSTARVTNGHHFSHPGCSEMIVGFADPRIDSNDKKPNPNMTVLEWLHGRPGFRGRVAAVGMWDAAPWILNRERCGFDINAGLEPLDLDPMTPEIELLNRLKRDIPTQWGDYPFDALTFHTALAYIKAKKPRVFYLTLGETDEWAHEGRYDQYLIASRRTDQFLKELWETIQSMPEYRGTTTLIVSTDHGRGDAPIEWRTHKAAVKGSEYIWIAAIGPDTPALGERTNIPSVSQGQIAATLARAAGEDYVATVPRAAPPIDGVVVPALKR